MFGMFMKFLHIVILNRMWSARSGKLQLSILFLFMLTASLAILICLLETTKGSNY